MNRDNGPEARDSLSKELSFFQFMAKNVLAITVAMIFILAAIILSKSTSTPDSILSLFGKDFWASFLKEIAFAIIVALFISFVFNWKENKDRSAILEEFSDKQLVKFDSYISRVEDMRITSVESMLLNVKDMSLPVDYSRAVREQWLEPGLVRTSCEIVYKLTSLEKFTDVETFEKNSSRFVVLRQLTTYTIRNFTTELVSSKLSYAIPKRGTGTLANVSKIVSVKIAVGEKPSSPDDYDEPKGFSQPNPCNGHETATWDISLEAGASATVQIVSILLKEKSDSELFVSYYAILNTRIDLQIDVEEMSVGLRVTAPCGCREIDKSDVNSKSWQIDGPILPHQATNLWWQHGLDNAEPAEA